MVVLNFYGKIEPICVSEKLKLYISNLPKDNDNDWQETMIDELIFAIKNDRIYQQKLETNYPCRIAKLYHNIFPDREIPSQFDYEQCAEIAENMVCIYQAYDYDDMPLGGWDTNCFDGRSCEVEYSEKLVDFINFLSAHDEANFFPKPSISWVYSSNYYEVDQRRIFLGGDKKEEYIDGLLKWGKLFDNFLQSRNDYLMLDYLVNSNHKGNDHNEQHLMKAYSLCQLFLEKENESELDKKLVGFIDDSVKNEEKENCARLLRQLRNKLAHGDFLAFESKIEEFACKFMDNSFWFDYTEYSRKNWAIGYICCMLDEIIRKLVFLMFDDRDALTKIKNQKQF